MVSGSEWGGGGEQPQRKSADVASCVVCERDDAEFELITSHL